MKLSRLVFMTSVMMLSCTASKEAQEKYKILAADKYRENVDYVFNESKSFVLCQNLSKSTILKPENAIRFFVYDMKNDAVVIEESYANGSVRWINDHAIEVTYHLGVASKDPSLPHSGKYIFDIITKQRSTDQNETK